MTDKAILTQSEVKQYVALTFSIIALLIVAPPVYISAAAPYSAPPLQPQATAEAAAATAQAASAIEAVAWGQATAQAAQATAEAQATAAAEVQAAATAAAQATATAAEITAEARAFQVQITRQAADLDATRAVYELDVTRAAIANVQQAEALAVERERTLRPLKLYGPWVVFFLLIALTIWGARRLAPAVETYLESQATGGGGPADGSARGVDKPAPDEERVFVMVSPLDWATGPFEGEYRPHDYAVDNYVIRGN